MGIVVVAHDDSSKRRIVRCSNCGEAGHNIRSCPADKDGDDGLADADTLSDNS